MTALDPRTKVAAFTVTVALAFICRDAWAIAALIAAVAAAAIASGKGRDVARPLKTMLPTLAVAFVLWSALYKWSLLHSYAGEGFDLSIGLFMTLRLLLIVLASLTFVSIVTPRELVGALESLGLPYRLVFVLGLTLRHVSKISEEYLAIKEAQALRGLELDKGSLVRRIRNYVPVLIPLFVRSIESADRLALAMELKSFSLSKKRARRKARLGAADWAVLGALAAAFLISVLHYSLGVI